MRLRPVVIGTRGSALSIWQAEHVAGLLRLHHPGLSVTLQQFTTRGDRIIDKPLPEFGGKGVFTAEIESALHRGAIDLAVHSLKDLPTTVDPAFTLGAIPARASPFDVLISRSGQRLGGLPPGATVGTSSVRRSAQIKAARPDLRIDSLRGNVPTRVDKLFAADSPYTAIVIAAAGLERLGMAARITQMLGPDVMLPAPGQGALAVERRTDDLELRELLEPLDDFSARIEVTAERAFLAFLEAGCSLPVAALGRFDPGRARLEMTGRVCSADGARMITLSDELYVFPGSLTPDWVDQRDSALHSARRLGETLADEALAQGARSLL